MSFQPLPAERNVSKFDVRRGFAFVRTPASGGLPGVFGSAISCGAHEVALIDEICVSTVTNDTATNKTITCRINGVSFLMHFPGTANLLRTERLVWRPRGNLVVHPGQTFVASGSGAFKEHMFVRFRKKGLLDAIRDGDISGHGSLPAVASTNTVAGGGTAAGTAKAIVPAVAGKCVEVLAMLFTGHNYNAAADNIRLGFWDGTTGTFGANGNTISRAWRQNANVHYAKPLVIGDTGGCIQGPSGSGVYIQATANLAGATPTGDWVIVYRYIDEDKLEVADPTGAAGGTILRRQKFWVNTEAAVTSTLGQNQRTRFWAATTGNESLVKIKGWIASATLASTASGIGTGTSIGLGLGNGVDALALGQTLGETLSMFASDLTAGAPAAVGYVFGQDDELVVTNLSSIPSFSAVEEASGDIANRSQTAWGRFESGKITTSDTAGQSVIGYIT